MNIRQTIHNELQRRNWSRYQLERKLKGKIPSRTVYAYLSGECDLGSEKVSIILTELNLTVESPQQQNAFNSFVK